MPSGKLRGSPRGERAIGSEAERDAENAGGAGEDHALGEQLADHGRAAGSKSGADGEFAAAGEGAGEQQAGDVGAADEEQDGDGGGEDPQLRAQIGDDDVAEGRDDHGARRVRVRRGGILGAVLPIEDGELSIGLGQRGAAGETRGEAEVADAHANARRGHERQLEVARGPYLSFADEGELHGGGQDANDGAGRAVERDDGPDNVGIAAEAGAPERVREEDDGMAFGAAFLSGEGAAQRGADAEHGEEIRRDAGDGYLHRLANTGEVEVVAGPRGGFEGAGVVAEQLVAEQGEWALVGVRIENADELLRLAVGKGTQQQRAGDGEDGGVGSDGEGEGEDGDEGEAGVAAEHAQAEAEVAEERLHAGII